MLHYMSPASFLLFLARDTGKNDAAKPHLYPQILLPLVKNRFIARTKMCREPYQHGASVTLELGNIHDAVLGRREEATPIRVATTGSWLLRGKDTQNPCIQYTHIHIHTHKKQH